MDTMIGIILLLESLPPVYSEVTVGGLRVYSQVRANVYTYVVTNHDNDPVVRFEVPYGDGYYFHAPEGWHTDSTDGVFRSWTDKDLRKLYPGRPGTFYFRVTSRGAVLGPVQAVAVLQSGRTVTLPNVWGAVPEPRGHVLLLALVVTGICVMHARWTAQHDDESAPPPTGATLPAAAD